MHITRALWMVAPIILTAGAVHADDLEDKGFGLRLSAALTRASRYPDSMAIGGAGGGSPWSSSPNPASSGLNPSVGKSGWGASAQHFQVLLESGSRIRAYSLSAAYDGGSWGNLQPAVLLLDTNRAAMKNGLTFDWEVVSGELQWARKINPCTAIGANLSYLESELDFDFGPLPAVESSSKTYSVRLGVLRRLARKTHVGVAVEYSHAPSETTEYDFMGLGVGTRRSEDTTHGITVRPGAYFFLTKDLTAYVDYQFAWFKDDTESLGLHRLHFGFDQTVIEGVYLRTGGILDSEGNGTWTVGVGIAPSESVYIDLAYQLNMFPELNPEFGRADVFGVGLTVLF